MSSSAPSSRNGVDLSEEQRRSNEISMFAAMALGDDWDPPASAASFEQKEEAVQPSPKRDSSPPLPLSTNGDDAFLKHLREAAEQSAPMAEQSENDEGFLAALKATQEEDFVRHTPETPKLPQRDATQQQESGTFAFDKEKPVTSVEQSNLAAALAGLEKDDRPSAATSDSKKDNQKHPHPLTSSSTTSSYRAHQQQKNFTRPEDTAPMFSEQVILPRPLFFGPLLPPRVVLQARQMVLDHINAQSGTTKGRSKSRAPPQQPRLEDLPGPVRNVVGAVRVYGYGIDVLKDLKEDDPDSQFWRGNPYVSTYQPVWGEAERAQRMKDIQNLQQQLLQQQRATLSKNPPGSGLRYNPERPSIVSRSSTAPGRLPQDNYFHPIMVMDIDQDNEDGDDDNSIFHESKTDHLDDAGESNFSDVFDKKDPDNAFPTANDSSPSPWSPVSHTPFGQQSNPSSQITANNQQFSAWLRGDDDPSVQSTPGAGDFSSFGSAFTGSVGGSFVGGAGGSGGGSSFVGGAGGSGDSFVGPVTPSTTAESSWTTANHSVGLSKQSSLSETEKNGESPSPSKAKTAQTPTGKPLSEQEIFLQLVRGEASGAASSSGTTSSSSTLLGEHATSSIKSGTSSASGANKDPSSGNSNLGGTFQLRPVMAAADSDDDSVEHDERKKQVGLNDHLSKALASLSEDNNGGGQPQQSIDVADESAQGILLPQMPSDGSGRALTNYEVTRGCVPIFGDDDPPLPVEGDLGIHETKEEQQKYHESKRAQEIVERFVKPDIFGTVACPNPALGPDDFHSWNARVVAGNQRLAPISTTATPPSLLDHNSSSPAPSSSSQNFNFPSAQPNQSQQQPGPESPPHKQQHTPLPSPQQSPSPQSQSPQSLKIEQRGSQHSESSGRPPRSSFKGKSGGNKRKLSSRTRYGWWNAGDQDKWPGSENEEAGNRPVDLDSFLDNHTSSGEEASAKLHRPPMQHSATALQVVTQLEPAPHQLQNDNLPLSHMHAATSMAQSLPYLSDRPPSHRYLEIDTKAIRFPPVGGEIEPLFCSVGIFNIETLTGSSASGSSSSAGERNGTSLPDLQRCGRVTELLHFDTFSDETVGQRCKSALWPYDSSSAFSRVLNAPDQIDSDPSARRIGTRCGVFPLPSNLKFANLYAVLIVKKVLSDDPPDIYLKGGPKPPDLEKLRSNAEKASQRQSAFLLPFAFGVAPLLQVFGGSDSPECPLATSSRAVQIPLFRFSPGQGERQIIDHIMVMLSPRDQRNPSGGNSVTATNGGIAMLVMRNFGYLGLHQVFDGTRNLARDRLVNFSGELQLRRKTDYQPDKEDDRPKHDGCTTTLPEWKPDLVAEPAAEGGRYLETSKEPSTQSNSNDYAQELSPIRLQLSASLRMASSVQQGVSRSRMSGHDIEPFYHTTFCNEMLLQPRLLHNCPKGNIVVKAELREIEWNEGLAAYFAHLPRCGPSLHNNRRGPFLVQSVLTSCSPRGSDKHFMDEFKLKLPLDLRPPVKARSFCIFFTVYLVKLNAKSKWKRAKKIFSGNELNGTEHQGSSSCRVDQIASGFFPISRNGGCLIDDGIHDVRIMYTAQAPPTALIESGVVGESSLMLVERVEPVEGSYGREHSFAEDTTSNGSGAHRSDESMTSASDFISTADDSFSRSDRGKSVNEPITLSVRVCANSSLHAQNTILSDYLQEEEGSERASDLNKNAFLSKISMGKEHIVGESASTVCSPEEQRLLRSTLDIVKYNICPVTRSHCFLLRAMTRLWRTLILGTGEASLTWANPATPIPLRLHAFASILQLLGGSSLFLTKNGLTQVDGTSKWSIVSLGRVIALFFDEHSLFGSSAAEVFHPSFLRLTSPKEKQASEKSPPHSGRRKRHVRNTFELFDTFQPSPEQASSSVVSPRNSPGHTRRLSDISSRQLDILSHQEITAEPATLQRPQQRTEVMKVDSKSDFQSALRAAAAAEDDFDKPESDGTRSAKAMIQAFAGPSSSSRKWMTAPSRALSTIKEQEDTEGDEPALLSVIKEVPDAKSPTSAASPKDSLDSEILLDQPKKTVKQMRIPRSRKSSGSFDFSSIELKEVSSVTPPPESPPKPHSVPKSDDEIESAGTAFLDAIGRSIGIGAGARGMATEEQRVGSSHHRKTRTKSSIDWTLIGIGDGSAPAALEESEDIPKDFTKDQNEGLSTLKNEEKKCIVLPDFADRLTALERQSAHQTRWFPFAYEVIILQWAAILAEQRALGERVRPDRAWKSDRPGESDEHSADDGVTEAATRSIGVAVAGAPLLFEIIKDSLGFRIASLFREGLVRGSVWTSPPLVVLDDTLFLGLEQVISMVADACIDSRNFDSWELRQMSIDVNDSIIRFLRDMFSFLAPKTVHQLILSYLQRFVTKEGKHWQDRDSSIGLRCSWEITKLRLNAITGLVRFPDFIRVNGPQMLNWSNWWSPSHSRSDSFFDEIFESYRSYRMPSFVGAEGSAQNMKADLPGINPHWLAEIAVDICLLGTEHAEPQIQQRAGALVHEMFWACSQQGLVTGQGAPTAGMHLTFVWKILSRTDFLANFGPKSQLRKDLLPCLVYVLQSAPSNLLRALWRRLCKGLKSKGASDRYGGFSSVRTRTFSAELSPRAMPRKSVELKDDPDVLDMFTLLNLALRTIEYEGSEENLEDGAGASRESVQLWQKEFLPSASEVPGTDTRRKRLQVGDRQSSDPDTSTNVSRRWAGHDGALVVVNAGHQMVWELYRILNAAADSALLLNPAVRVRGATRKSSSHGSKVSGFTHADITVFVRAASSLYLHALALRQSDIVIVRAFKVSAELIKIFGIKTFLESVGETLQHWMRVISLQCGARRAHVRIEATDLLELILRSTWQNYGSFFRIRVPLLAVQTEVMERIVATAASRYYRDQRRLQADLESSLHTDFEPFSNVSAEASLVPLWRTLDRMEKQPASQNVAFRGALIRMAGKLKKLYRAYIAARVLSFIQGLRGDDLIDEEFRHTRDHATEALVRANRISILRVINASEGHSKQFLGFHATTRQRSRVAHFEAVEDALINAADVFSSNELPEHRVAWLRMLADFHSSRRKFAEEATCHFHIHVTLQQAARLHGSLWSNTPFLPWTDNMPDPVYIDGDNVVADPYGSDYDFDEHSTYGRPINSFRRIFYRVANSVAMHTNEWDTAANMTLFCGIASAIEYDSVSPWVTLRDMEAQMVEEAELSGELFLRAGIIESSRFAWNLATQFYAQKFNYAKLAMAYRNLERTVVSKVPPVDTSLPQEFSATLGRFYRVWFHGGAPDELNGVEFVYRTNSALRLDTFGQELKEVIKSIIPDNTPIRLFLDGRNEERFEEGSGSFGFTRLGQTTLEPVRIKVTPLRPLFDNNRSRGLPEWFYQYADEAFETLHHRSKSEIGRGNPRSKGSPSHTTDSLDPHHREHGRTYSASIFSSGSSSGNNLGRRAIDDRGSRFASLEEGELSGVDKFCFVQPKDRSRSKDWWRNSGGDFADKALKVTQLQVAQSFPACVGRQPVVHRLVYTQSPLEAGIDAVCQWCSVLFRTAVATVGMAVLGTNHDPGIGTDAVKTVADCIHSSHVKEIGLALMKKSADSREENTTNDLSLENYDRLSDDEIRKLQIKLARLIIVFIELLHLLIARNRQLLLDFMQERKRSEASIASSVRPPGRPPTVSTATTQEPSNRWNRGQRANSAGSQDLSTAPTSAPVARDQRGAAADPRNNQQHHQREASLSDYVNPRRLGHQRSNSEDHHSVSSNNINSTTAVGRGESAIAVQSELQRAFINMVKTLYPKVQGILQGDTPRWLKQCAQDTYFSLGTYKQTQIPIDEELCYTAESMAPVASPSLGEPVTVYDRGSSVHSPRGSSNLSVVSRGSDRFNGSGYGHL